MRVMRVGCGSGSRVGPQIARPREKDQIKKRKKKNKKNAGGAPLEKKKWRRKRTKRKEKGGEEAAAVWACRIQKEKEENIKKKGEAVRRWKR